MILLFLYFANFFSHTNSQNVNYNDFASWTGQCNIGQKQSPINIITSNTRLCGNSQFKINLWNGLTTVIPDLGSNTNPSNLISNYPTSILTIIDSQGQLLQYMSKQYHLHTPSEHQINGIAADLELHIVHALNSDIFKNQRTLAVVGLMFSVDDNAASTIFDKIDFTANQSVNFNSTIGKLLINQNIFHYQGSLTTPQCSQIVNWYVVSNIYPIRSSQLNAIKLRLWNNHSNSRPVQYLNDRKIQFITPTCGIEFSYQVIKLGVLNELRLGFIISISLIIWIFFN